MVVKINYKSKKILCYAIVCGNHIHDKPKLHTFISGACGAMQTTHAMCEGSTAATAAYGLFVPVRVMVAPANHDGSTNRKESMIIAKLALVAALIIPAGVATAAAADASPSSGCSPAIQAIIRRDFGRAAPWAIGIAWRESRCQPGAANRRSQARGIFQMMVPLHARQFAAVGCSWRQWANANCNIAAAAHLYREQGTRPWR